MRAAVITLAADGPSDRCLIQPIRWAFTEALRANDKHGIVQFIFARVRSNPLTDRIVEALRDYPCDVLVVHRDSERENPDRRREEIGRACEGLVDPTPRVPVIPVRMSEAWLLIDEKAIRIAAGNPQGVTPLRLPRVRDLESLSDPKDVLRDAILDASTFTGRRRDRLRRDLPERVQRVAQLIGDYSQLRALSAFRRFEEDLATVLEQMNWLEGD
jgi:hypothetical protein